MESQHCSNTPGAVSSMGHPKGFGKSFSHVPAQGQPFSNSLARLFSSRGHFALPTCETCPGVHSPPRAFLPKLFPDPFYCTMGRHPFPAQRGSGDNQCMGYKSLRSPGTSSETPWVRPQQAPLAGWSCGCWRGPGSSGPSTFACLSRPRALPAQRPSLRLPPGRRPLPSGLRWIFPFSAQSVLSLHQPLIPLPHLLFPFTLPFLLPPTRQASHSPQDSKSFQSFSTLTIPFPRLPAAPSHIPL